MSRFSTALSIATAGVLLSGTAWAQQVTGTLGSPDATTTIPGKQLPPVTRVL